MRGEIDREKLTGPVKVWDSTEKEFIRTADKDDKF
jgi:hypothetical protein